LRAQKTEADERARRAEAARRSAESAHAETVRALEAVKQQTAVALKQKDDADRQNRNALGCLAEEQGRRVLLKKALAEQSKLRSAPKFSFVRNWQLLGPFASAPERGHDTVYSPEREPVQLARAYDGFGGPVKWRQYHSIEDKIDLAHFFNYREAGAAYAVSWAFSDRDQAITLAVGSDDGVRLWVNREKVHDIKGGRQARPGQDLVKARLKKGWNEVLVKVDNIIGTWEFYLEFRTADGGEPLRVLSTSSPPPATGR
jgi:hypothetical protein